MEIFQGPVVAPMHVTGVGGAYIASAEGTEGTTVNSAAPAVRQPYSSTWFDYDIALGISFPGAFTSSDFDNHGDNANLPPQHSNVGSFTDVNVGGTLQFGGLGVSAAGDLQQFSLTTTAPGQPALTLQIGRWKGLAAYGMFGGQLALGGGVRVVTMQVLQDGGGALLNMAGVSPEAGALLMPTGQPWRVGVTARAPVSGGVGVGFLGQQIFSGSQKPVSGNLVVPSQVVMPWEVEAGLAYQLGPRPLNPGWENPRAEDARLREEIEQDRDGRKQRYEEELAALTQDARRARAREQLAEEKALRSIEDEHLDEERERQHRTRKARYANWPREHILLLASVLVTGQSPNAVSEEGFLDQRVETVGRRLSVTPRLGLEGEPLQNHMLLRTGTYVEPSRYDGGTARQHFTFGADVKLVPLTFWGLFPDDPWKLGIFVDLAPRYTNWGFGLGTWH